MKVIFCGAHPDDAEIYAFGTLLAWRAAGAEVVLHIAARGNMGTAARAAGRDLADVRREEAETSAALLGARLVMSGLPDLGIGPARLRLASQLQHLFHLERPDVIITHSANDYHADHRALSVTVALAAGDDYPVVFADTMKGAGFTPTHFVDIARFQERKFAAIRLHHSQKPRRYVLAAQALAAGRGRQATGQEGRVMEGFRFETRPGIANAMRLFPPGTSAAQPACLPGLNGHPPADVAAQVTVASPNPVRKTRGKSQQSSSSSRSSG